MDPIDPGRGPHPVGVVSIDVSDDERDGRTLPVDLWYPAEASTVDDDASTQPRHPFQQVHRACIDAAPLAEACPVIAFSHGNRGLRQQSTFLTTQLASHGFVVVAPDHMGNTFPEMLGKSTDTLREMHFEARRNRPADLKLALDRALEGDTRWPQADATRIASLGHSFGGWTAVKLAALEPRLRAVCAMAPAVEPFVGRKAFAADELPLREGVASLLLAGMADALVDLDASVRLLFDRLAEPRALIGIDDADHFHFCDGIQLLHEASLQDTGRKLLRKRLSYDESLDEARMQRLLCGVVTRFFAAVLAGDPPHDAFTPDALKSLDPALHRLEA